VTLTLDTRARLLLLVLLFVLAASAASFMAFRAMHRSSEESGTITPVAVPAPKMHGTSSAVAKHGAPATHPHAAAAPAPHRPAAVPPKAKPQPAAPAPPNDLPAAIRNALAADRVVVVALYDPDAKIDAAALAEAKAGARLGDSAFVPVNVRSHAVDSLNARYGAVQDPAVLVLRPPDSLVVRIDGFADKATVAQAASNAAS
jgi:hypothetical protein